MIFTTISEVLAVKGNTSEVTEVYVKNMSKEKKNNRKRIRF